VAAVVLEEEAEVVDVEGEVEAMRVHLMKSLVRVPSDVVLL